MLQIALMRRCGGMFVSQFLDNHSAAFERVDNFGKTESSAFLGGITCYQTSLGCRCYSIGGLLPSLGLSAALYILAKRCTTYSVYRSRIGMRRRDFDCYHCRPTRYTLTPQIGDRIEGGGQNLTLELRPNGDILSKTLY